MIDEANKKNIKQGPSYAEIQPKISDLAKYQKVAVKVEEIKKEQKVHESKTPNLQDNKKYPPHQSEKILSIDVIPSAKKQDVFEPKPSNLKPPLPNKPPMPPSSQKEPIKVKNEKVIQPKVYESQKNIGKPPQAIIKSAGFNPIAPTPA
jgi:hypothetical protein